MERPLIVVSNSDRIFLEMMAEILDEEGYETVVVQDPDQTYSLVKQRQPNLVIIELLMTDPERGLMVLAKMRLDPATAAIPVIIASTSTQLIRENEALLRAKRCDILFKPFELKELVTVVDKYMPHQH